MIVELVLMDLDLITMKNMSMWKDGNIYLLI